MNTNLLLKAFKIAGILNCRYMLGRAKCTQKLRGTILIFTYEFIEIVLGG